MKQNLDLIFNLFYAITFKYANLVNISPIKIHVHYTVVGFFVARRNPMCTTPDLIILT